MDKEIAWKKFEKTGTIENYLKYKLESLYVNNDKNIKNINESERKPKS